LSCFFSVLLRLRKGSILDDEDLLARPDQSELAPRNFLNRRRLFAKAAGLVAEPSVIGPQPEDGRRERLVFLPRSKHREQSSFTHETIGDDHGRDEEQQNMNNPPVAHWMPARCAPACGFVNILDHDIDDSTSTRP
jgi:hypothetical protein